MTLDYTVFDIENNLLDSGATALVYLHGGYGDVFEKLEKALKVLERVFIFSTQRGVWRV